MTNSTAVLTTDALPLAEAEWIASRSSYERAEDFRPDALAAALADLDGFARQVEEFIEIHPARLEGTEFTDMDGSDETGQAQTVLAGLLCEGGVKNDQGWLAWVDDDGREVFAWTFDEVKAKADPRACLRLIERFPVESGEGR